MFEYPSLVAQTKKDLISLDHSSTPYFSGEPIPHKGNNKKTVLPALPFSPSQEGIHLSRVHRLLKNKES